MMGRTGHETMMTWFRQLRADGMSARDAYEHARWYVLPADGSADSLYPWHGRAGSVATTQERAQRDAAVV